MGASTTESDSSGNGYHLTSVGNSTVVAGKLGYARSLLATQVAGIGLLSASQTAFSNALFYGDWTLSVWIYPTTMAVGSILLRVSGSFIVLQFGLEPSLDGLGNYYLHAYYEPVGTHIIDSATTIPPNVWAYLTLTRTNTGASQTFKQYINGVPTSTFAGQPIQAGTPTTTPINVGYVSGAGNYAYRGSLDELCVKNVALSDAQILADYNSQVAGTPLSPDANTVALWHFDDSTYGSNVAIDTQATNSKGDARVARPLIQGATVQAVPSAPPKADPNSKNFNGGFG